MMEWIDNIQEVGVVQRLVMVATNKEAWFVGNSADVERKHSR